MQPEPQGASPGAHDSFTPRQTERDALARLLPLKGVEANSKRVITVWGEREVGKTAFIASFRESELMAKSKALWIQPTRGQEALDTVEEFILSCSKSIRYPGSPEKEEPIARKLESVQRGKINPIVSDDSLLITRSTLATNRKPYINQAAASSVGRTEVPKEDVEVSVGLGESKATNQAEGFLDALPLQALGTDLIILYLENLDRLSLTVADWLRDYVIPAATRGPYRRSMVFLIESPDPLELAYPNDSWGEWDSLRASYRLHPLSERDTYDLALREGLEPDCARYAWFRSRGYPALLNRSLAEAKSGLYSGPASADADRLMDRLSEQEQLKLGALCLPNVLYADELDALFGPERGKETLKWLAATGPSLLRTADEGHGFSLPHPFRLRVLARVGNGPEFKPYRRIAASMARLAHNVSFKSDRAKLLMLSGLCWIEESLCRELFGEKAERILAYVIDNPAIFNRNQERYRVTERLRPELSQVAEAMEHPGIKRIREQAWALWERRREEIEGRVSELETRLARRQDAVNRLIRRQSETAAQLRVQERKLERDEAYSDYTRLQLQRPSRGPLILLLLLVAVALFLSGYAIPFPFNLLSLVLGLAALSIGLAYIPGWLSRRRAVALSIRAQTQDSPEHLRKQNLEITHQVQAEERELDELKEELDQAKALLRFPFAVPATAGDSSEQETDANIA